jgi:hypothetical protein
MDQENKDRKTLQPGANGQFKRRDILKGLAAGPALAYWATGYLSHLGELKASRLDLLGGEMTLSPRECPGGGGADSPSGLCGHGEPGTLPA